MRPDSEPTLKKKNIHRSVAGFTLLAFLLTQLVWPMPASAWDTLRQEAPPENKADIEELADRLQDKKKSSDSPLLLDLGESKQAQHSFWQMRNASSVTPIQPKLHPQDSARVISPVPAESPVTKTTPLTRINPVQVASLNAGLEEAKTGEWNNRELLKILEKGSFEERSRALVQVGRMVEGSPTFRTDPMAAPLAKAVLSNFNYHRKFLDIRHPAMRKFLLFESLLIGAVSSALLFLRWVGSPELFWRVWWVYPLLSAYPFLVMLGRHLESLKEPEENMRRLAQATLAKFVHRDVAREIWEDSTLTSPIDGYESWLAQNRIGTRGSLPENLRERIVSLPILPSHTIKLPFRASSHAIDPSGTKLAVLYENGTFQLLDLQTTYFLGSPQKFAEKKISYGLVAFGPDGKTLAIGGFIGKESRFRVVFWNLAENKPSRQIRLPIRSIVSKFYFTSDGKAIVTLDLSGALRFWDLETGKGRKPSAAFLKRKGPYDDFALNVFGSTVVGRDEDGVVEVRDMTTGKIHSTFRVHSNRNLLFPSLHTEVIALNPDSTVLASVRWSLGGEEKRGEVHFWDVQTGVHLSVLRLPVEIPEISLGRDLLVVDTGSEIEVFRPMKSLESSVQDSELPTVLLDEGLVQLWGEALVHLPSGVASSLGVTLNSLLDNPISRKTLRDYLQALQQNVSLLEDRTEALLFYLAHPVARSPHVADRLARTGLPSLSSLPVEEAEPVRESFAHLLEQPQLQEVILSFLEILQGSSALNSERVAIWRIFLEHPRTRIHEVIAKLLPGTGGIHAPSWVAIHTHRPSWFEEQPSEDQLAQLRRALSYLPPVGGKVPLVIDKDGIAHNGPLLTAGRDFIAGTLPPTRAVEDQVEMVVGLRQKGHLGQFYVHQLTVQGRLPDEFKYAALALILHSPYSQDWSEPFFEAPWGSAAPLIHDGGAVEMSINPMWNQVPGRTDFLNRIAISFEPALEVLERMPPVDRLERFDRDETAGQRYEREKWERNRLRLEAMAYQRLALALHAYQGTAPGAIPQEIRRKLGTHWEAFRSAMQALLQEYSINQVAKVPWFTRIPRPLKDWPGLRYEAPYGPIEERLVELERIRKKHPEMVDRVRRLLAKAITDIDQDIGLSAGLEEAEIEVQGPNGSIKWKVPATVKEAMDWLSSENPRIAEAHSRLREGILQKEKPEEKLDETGGSPFLFYEENQKLFFWILEHISDPTLDITESERGRVSWHLLWSLQDFSASITSTLKGSFQNENALESWWYLIVRLLVLEQRISQLQPSTGLVQRHLRLIELAYQTISWLIHAETRRSPKDFYERRLMDLAISQPLLSKQVHDLLGRMGDWAKEVFPSEVVLSYEEMLLKSYGQDEGGSITPAEIAKQAEGQSKLANRLLELRSVLTPRSPETQEAWDHPIRYLIQLASGKEVVYFKTPSLVLWERDQLASEKPELHKVWLFQLDWLDEMGKAGFKRWLFSSAVQYLEPIQRWVSDVDQRSLEDFTVLLQEYINGSGTVPIRTYLLLPDRTEPVDVTRALIFLENLRDLRQNLGVDISLHLDLDALKKKAADKYLTDWIVTGQKKSLILGPLDLASLLPDEKTAVIKQTIALDFYYSDEFHHRMAFPHVAYQIGETRGWGDRRSVAVPIRHNEPLQQFVERWERKGLDAGRIIRAWWANDDALVVTSEKPEGEEQEERTPLADADTGLRTGSRRLVPVGPAELLSGEPKATGLSPAGLEEGGKGATRREFLKEAAILSAGTVGIGAGIVGGMTAVHELGERFPTIPKSATAQQVNLTVNEARQILQGLANKWNLTNLTELRIAAVTPQVVAGNSRLRELIGKPVSVGNATLVVVPEEKDRLQDLVVSFMDEVKPVIIQGYGQVEDTVLDNFEQAARLVGFAVHERVSPKSQAFRDLLRQLIANLSELQAAAIQEEDLIALEQALSVLA